MALSPTVLAGLINSNLMSVGANGSNLTPFCTAVGAGIVMSIVGKAFTTLDTGLVTGIGAGVGTGITGLQSSDMVSIAIAQMATTGDNAEKLMQAIMNATVTHLGAASLVSVDPIVFVGAGAVVVGTIAVVQAEMASNIDSQLASVGAKGSNRTHLANAIAAGIAQEILSAGTGALVITGSPTVPTPVPGTGPGTGTIS